MAAPGSRAGGVSPKVAGQQRDLGELGREHVPQGPVDGPNGLTLDRPRAVHGDELVTHSLVAVGCAKIRGLSKRELYHQDSFNVFYSMPVVGCGRLAFTIFTDAGHRVCLSLAMLKPWPRLSWHFLQWRLQP